MSTDKSPHDSHRSLIRSTSIISVGTLASRVLGFVRDILLAKLMGTGVRADAFFVAFKIPNLFRDLVGEGATNSAVVPVFSEYRIKKEAEEFWRFVSVILVMALVLLSVLTILGILLAPFIVRALAPGFMADPPKLLLTIQLTRVMFPYLVLIGLTAYSMAILYTFRSFTAPAFSPCLLNVAMIASALMALSSKDPSFILAIGVLIGGVLQLAVQIPSMRGVGFRFYKPPTLRHPGAMKVWKLLLPRMFGAGVYQLTVLVDTFCASLSSIVGPGGISAIYYANRIIQFPMGVFTLALASAALPTLAGLASSNNHEQMKKTIVFTLENIFFVLFPTSVMIILLAQPIVRIFFERGEFNQYSTAITSIALLFYAIGLFSFGGIKILVTAFHALQDTKTPVKVAALCLVLNGALDFLLMYPMKIGGIALASSIAATVDFMILFHLLDKKLGGLNSGLRRFVFKVLLATLLTGLYVDWSWAHIGISWPIVRLAVVGISGMALYGVVCFFLKVEQAEKIFGWMVKR